MISKLGSSMTIFFKGMLMGIADLVPGVHTNVDAFIDATVGIVAFIMTSVGASVGGS